MKRIFLLAALALSTLMSFAQFSGSGSGTQSDPYRIFNADQLSQMRNFLNQSGVYFKLMNDLNISEWLSDNYPSQGWQPVGSSSESFKGVLDGNGKTISGFSINRSTNYVGLFAAVSGATIKNLTLKGDIKGGAYVGSLFGSGSASVTNYTFEGTVTGTGNYTGGVGGSQSTSSSNITVNATVKGASYTGGIYGSGRGLTSASFTGQEVTGTTYVGGLEGQGSGTFSSCTVNAPVKGTSQHIGGLVGYANGAITFQNNCTQQGNVTGTEYAGGLVGYASLSFTANNCSQEGDITGTRYLGGLVGYANKSFMANTCSQKGDITGTGDYVGGLVGRADSSTASNCKHEGSVSGTESTGGLVGYVSGDITLENCTQRGNITGREYTGGIIGFSLNSAVTLTSCYAEGDITGNVSVGGICGMIKTPRKSSISGCNYWGNITGSGEMGGIIGVVRAGTANPTSIDFDTTTTAGYRSGTNDYYKNTNCFYNTSNPDFFFLNDTSKPDYTHYYYVDETDIASNISLWSKSSSNVRSYTINAGNQKILSYSYSATTVVYNNRQDQTYDWSVSIINCSAIGNINGTSQYIGGIIGKDVEGNYTDWNLSKTETVYYYEGEDTNTATKSLTLKAYSRTSTTTDISESYFSGNLTGTDYIGGIAGNKQCGSINKCYASASVAGGQYVGGIVGSLINNNLSASETSLSANVSLCTSITGTSNVGKIYGATDGNFSVAALGTNSENRSLATMQVVVGGSAQAINDNLQNGTAIGISQFRLKANYVAWGWDFNNNWTILETQSFPYKTWQSAPPVLSEKLTTGATTISGNSTDGGTVYLTTENGTQYTATANTSGEWSTTVPALHTGETVSLYAHGNNKEKSYITTATAGFLGSGTESDPYQIHNAYDLQGIYASGYYKIMTDIDLTSWIQQNSPTNGWVPCGSSPNTIYIDGDNHKITGLWTNRTLDYAGLFANFSEGSIHDLTVEVATGKQVKGRAYSGIVIGDIGTGTIKNVTAQGNVSGSSYSGVVIGHIGTGTIENVTAQGNVSGGNYVGAVIGRIGTGTIENVTAKGNASGGSFVGGIAGYTAGTVLHQLFYTGQLTASGDVGGITSYCSTSTPVTDCEAKDIIIKTTDGTKVGGLVGNINSTSFNKCNVTGTISRTGTSTGALVGGLVASCSSSITECTTNVTIINASPQGMTAGLVASNSGTIKRCSVAGSVTSGGTNALLRSPEPEPEPEAAEGAITGGLVAKTTSGSGIIEDCYSTADVSGTEYTGGLVGLASSAIERCYALGNVSGELYGGGIVAKLTGTGAHVKNCVALNNQLTFTAPASWAARVIGGYDEAAGDPDGSNLALATMQVTLNNVSVKKYDDLVEGIAKSEAELKQQATYTAMGWEFDNVWAMNGRTGLPYLQWNNPDKEEQTLELTTLPAMTYGDAAYTLPAATTEGQALTWTSSNTSVATISGNTLTIKGAGTATITATQAGGNLYLPFSREFSLTIAKAMLTVTAQSCTKQEGEENPVLTVTYSGFKYDDDASVLTTQPIVTTTATASSPVGSYPITVSGAEAANYNFTYVAGTLTVVDETAQDNTLAALDAKGLVGSKTTLAIALTNANDVSLCQFDLRLPEGVTVALNARNKLDATLTNRASTHTISSRQLSNGDYRFVVSSNDGDSFVGNEGILMNIVLDIAEDAEAGNRIIRVLNIELSLPEGNDLKIVNPADAESTLTISSYKPGDVNGDDKVSVTDVGYAINYILEQVPSVFIFDAADMNHDGKISVTDVGYIINIILSDDGPSHARRKAAAQDMQQDGVATLAQSGTEHRLYLDAENCIGFQMDVMLPQGIELSAARLDAMSCADHTLTFRRVAENKYRILCYSPTNSTLNRAADALLSLTTTAATDGMTVTDILFTTASLDEVAFVIGDDATGIASMGADGKDAMYDLQGRRVDSNRLHKGIYLSKGRKSVKK